MNNGKVKLVEYFLSIVVLFQVVKLITVNVSLNNVEKFSSIGKMQKKLINFKEEISVFMWNVKEAKLQKKKKREKEEKKILNKRNGKNEASKKFTYTKLK